LGSVVSEVGRAGRLTAAASGAPARREASRGGSRLIAPGLIKIGLGRLLKRDGAIQRLKKEALAMPDKIVKIYQDKA
jgi:hypothetical protein